MKSANLSPYAKSFSRYENEYNTFFTEIKIREMEIFASIFHFVLLYFILMGCYIWIFFLLCKYGFENELPLKFLIFSEHNTHAPHNKMYEKVKKFIFA